MLKFPREGITDAAKQILELKKKASFHRPLAGCRVSLHVDFSPLP